MSKPWSETLRIVAEGRVVTQEEGLSPLYDKIKPEKMVLIRYNGCLYLISKECYDSACTIIKSDQPEPFDEDTPLVIVEKFRRMADALRARDYPSLKFIHHRITSNDLIIAAHLIENSLDTSMGQISTRSGFSDSKRGIPFFDEACQLIYDWEATESEADKVVLDIWGLWINVLANTQPND